MIIIGDSRNMSEIKNNSVHLIVTSPPYFDIRDYGVKNQIGFGGKLETYLDSIREVFSECYRILQPGRKFCLNISDLSIKGEYGVKWIPLGSYLLNITSEVGFELADRIIWDKTPKKGFYYGSLPYPPSPLIYDSMEFIFILRKKGKSNYEYLNKQNKELSKLRRDEYGEYTKQIWTFNRVRLKNNINGHIAPFPVELPKRCIKLYSFVGDTVLDPFLGSGTTTKAAMLLRRNSIGYEINPDYLEIIKEKIDFSNERLLENIKIEIVHKGEGFL